MPTISRRSSRARRLARAPSPTTARATTPSTSPALLTERQQEVLFLLVDAAAPNRIIAQRLGTTEATVKVHMRAIFDRLRIDSRAEALHLVFSSATGWLAAQRTRREQG